MHTICPECSSVFRITTEQLKMAHGQVRCGFCSTIFDALGNLEEDWKDNLPEHQDHAEEEVEHELVFSEDDIDAFNEELEGSDNPPEVYQDNEEFPLEEIIAPVEKPQESNETSGFFDTNNTEEDDEPSVLAALFSQPAPTDEEKKSEPASDPKRRIDDLFDGIEDTSKATDDPIEPVTTSNENIDITLELKADNSKLFNPQIDDTPSVLRDELEIVMTDKSGSKSGLWLAGIIILTLMLAFQVIYIKREDIAKQESFRELMISMCEKLSCDIPLRDDASQGLKTMVIQQHAITKIKDQPEQLRIKAIFSNTAAYTQAYPVLSIKLSDHDNNVTAMRRFLPSEYLAKHINLAGGLPAKTAVEVIIDIIKPSTPVSSYQFDFY